MEICFCVSRDDYSDHVHLLRNDSLMLVIVCVRVNCTKDYFEAEYHTLYFVMPIRSTVDCSVVEISRMDDV